MTDSEHLRTQMVERDLAGRGIRDALVLQAFRDVPRESFIASQLAAFAYDDTPLPIEEGQTISQPYIVALTVEALELHGGERVLEVGTGSGYAAAILGRIAGEVYTIERLDGLATSARGRLHGLGYTNVHVLSGDGSLGWPEHAPYDAIAVSAGAPDLPQALLEQLAVGGRLVIPVGPEPSSQILTRVTRRSETDFRTESITDVEFVPLIGAQAWRDRSWTSRATDAGAARDLRF